MTRIESTATVWIVETGVPAHQTTSVNQPGLFSGQEIKIDLPALTADLGTWICGTKIVYRVAKSSCYKLKLSWPRYVCPHTIVWRKP